MSEPGWNPTSESGAAADSPEELIAGPRPPGAGFPKVDWGTASASASADGLDEGAPDELEDSLDDGEGDEYEVQDPLGGEDESADDGEEEGEEEEDPEAVATGAGDSRTGRVLAGLGAFAGGASTVAAQGVDLARRYPRAGLASGLSTAIMAAVMVLQPGKGKHDIPAQIPGPQANASSPADKAKGESPSPPLSDQETAQAGNPAKGAGPEAQPPALAGDKGARPDTPEDKGKPAVDTGVGVKVPGPDLVADNSPAPAPAPTPAPSPTSDPAAGAPAPAAEQVKLTAGEENPPLPPMDEPPGDPKGAKPAGDEPAPAPSPVMELAAADVKPGTPPPLTPVPPPEPAPTPAPAAPGSHAAPAPAPAPGPGSDPAAPSPPDTTAAAAAPAPTVEGLPPIEAPPASGSPAPAPAPQTSAGPDIKLPAVAAATGAAATAAALSAPVPALAPPPEPAGDPKIVEPKAGDPKAVESKPVDAKAVEPKPVDAKAVEPKPEGPVAGVKDVAGAAGKAASGAGKSAVAAGVGVAIGTGLGAALSALGKGDKDAEKGKAKTEPDHPSPTAPAPAAPAPPVDRPKEPAAPSPSPAVPAEPKSQEPTPAPSPLAHPAGEPADLPVLHPVGEAGVVAGAAAAGAQHDRGGGQHDPVPPLSQTPPQVQAQAPSQGSMPAPPGSASEGELRNTSRAAAPADAPPAKPEPHELEKQGWVRLKHAGAGTDQDVQRELPGLEDEGTGTGVDRGTTDPNAHADKEQNFEVETPPSLARGGQRAGEPADAVPPSPREEGKIDTVLHKVERGENFWSIARLYYPSGRYYRALWKYNSAKVKQIDKLYVGTILRIPPPEDLDPAYIDPPGPPPSGSVGQSLARRDDDAVDPARADSDATGRKASRAASRGGVPVRRSGRSDVELNLPVSDAADQGTRSRSREVNYADDRDAEPEVRPRATVTRPIYKVRPYDTLRTIARDTLGDSRRSGEILELNRDLIDDPAHLIVGQILELPEDARSPRARSRR